MMNLQQITNDFVILKRRVGGTTFDKSQGKPLVYLDNAATTQKPKQVIAAIVDYYEHHNANVARGVHTLAEEATDMYEQARKVVAEFIGAKSEEVVFVRNATEGLNLVAFSWGLEKLGKGDVILTSLLEHHSNVLPWRMVAERTRARLKYIDVDFEGKMILAGAGRRELVEGVEVGSLEALLDKHVALVAVSAKSNMTGMKQPVAEIIKQVRRVNKQTVVVVDGSHSVPHGPTDVGTMGADFLAFSGHKMLGPMGIGVLWGRKDRLNNMNPFLRGGDMIREVTLTGQRWHTLPHTFEAGTPNVAGAVGLAAAVKYLKKVGMKAVQEHERELTAYALEQLGKKQAELGIEILGSIVAEDRIGVVTFNIRGVHAHDVAQILNREGVAVRSGQHCTGPLMERLGIPASVRASVYVYTTQEDIDVMVKALEKVRHVFGKTEE